MMLIVYLRFLTKAQIFAIYSPTFAATRGLRVVLELAFGLEKSGTYLGEIETVSGRNLGSVRAQTPLFTWTEPLN